LEHLADLTAGELRIGSTEAMANGLLPVIIERLSRRHAGITFEVVLADPVTLQERELRGRRVDLIVGQRLTAGMADDLNGTVLYSDRPMIVAGIDNPWARRRKVVLADLANERWCLPPPGHPIGAMVIEAFRRTGLPPPRSIVTAPSAPFTSCLISEGQFLGVLGSSFLQIHVPRAPLKVLPVKLPTAAQSICVMTLKDRSLSPVAKLFIDGAREIVQSLAKSHDYRRGHRH
jgi:DNA-binding transcriptional LysR family regulator